MIPKLHTSAQRCTTIPKLHTGAQRYTFKKVDRMQKIKVVLISCISVFILFSIIGSILIIGAYSIPNYLIEDNVGLSEDILKEEKASEGWTEVFTHGWAGNLDSTTDSKIFGDAMVSPDVNAVQAAFGTYPRMWNGYMVIFRPLLIFFSYAQIRFLLYVVIVLLSWNVCTLLHKRLGEGYSFSYIASLIVANIILVPFNMIISIFMIIMSLFSIWVLKNYKSDTSDDKLEIVFFISGMTDIFFDMLTAPLIVLCLPILMILFIDARESRENSVNKGILKVFRCSVMWFTGYIVFWMMKWILSTVITGQNIVADAFNTLLFRVGGETGQNTGPVYSIVKNLGALLPTHGENLPALIFIYVIFAAFVIMCFIKHKVGRPVLTRYIPCYIVMIFPILWYIVVSNHSIIHATMYSYRLIMIPVFGCLSVLSELICIDGGKK